MVVAGVFLMTLLPFGLGSGPFISTQETVVFTCPASPPRWPSGKGSATTAADPRSNSAFLAGLFAGPVMPVPQHLALSASGVIGSALGLAGPVSVHCDGVRQQVHR